MNRCENYDPVPLELFANRNGTSLAEAEEFFRKFFGSYAQYVEDCRNPDVFDKKMSNLHYEKREMDQMMKDRN